jgi:hypothetical protein
MSTYELKRKPSESFKGDYMYFFLVNGMYHLAATYKTDEEAKKWYDKCREVFVEPIHTKLHTRMHKERELYLTQRQEVYVDPYNLEYYNKYSFYVMYGTHCLKSFIAYGPKENDLKLAEATEYFNSYVYVEYAESMAEYETLIKEETN